MTDTARDSLDAAIERYQSALRDTAVLSLRALAELARVEFPDARFLEFEWSDQGDFLTSTALYDETGVICESFDGQCIDWNLGDNCRGVWEPFMLPIEQYTAKPYNLRLERGVAVPYRLDLDRALAIPIPVEFA